MEATSTSAFRRFVPPCRRSVSVWCGTAMLALCLACSAPDRSDDPDPDAAVPASTYLAFSGGGWRTHTALAGWTIGLLDNQSSSPHQTLDKVFTNVSAVSSNSGGSWFNTMLAFSDAFAQRIEAPNAMVTYMRDPGGYFLSEQTKLQSFSATRSCDLWSSWPQLYFMCVVGEGIHAPLDWDALIRDVVFDPLSMSTKLKNTTWGGRTPPAVGQPQGSSPRRDHADRNSGANRLAGRRQVLCQRFGSR